ncbi:MAG: fimbria/pilus periplasmic chaperone [Hyphomicrobiaceae bacterium]
MQRLCNLLTFVAVSVAYLTVGTAQALTVSPVQVEMTSAGGKARATVTVVNNSTAPMPIEAVVQRMMLDESGKAQTSNAGDEFLVMPPQAMIAPGATQNFRIQWLGEPMLGASQSFYIFFNQVPVKQPAGKTAVQVVMSMGVMVNVAPPQGQAGLKVVTTGVATDAKGKRHPTITVQNPTNVHALLPDATIKLSSGGWSQTVPAGLLSETIGSGLVQPGKQRRFILPVDLPANISSVQASVAMTPRKP